MWTEGRRAKSANSPSSRRSGGQRNGSVAIRRTGDYAVDYALVNLAKVAGKTRVMPDAFIEASGNDITPAFLAYLRPLLGSGLPRPARLRGGWSPRC